MARTDRVEVTHLSAVRQADPRRVVLRPFIPANNPCPEPGADPSRVDDVIARVLSLGEREAHAELRRVIRRLSERHDDVARMLERRFHEMVAPAIPLASATPDQRRLIGAYFTEEYSFEAAALFNPSVVPHPDQKGLDPGALRINLSLRAVGEGHISSIVFQSGVLGSDGALSLDPPSRRAVSPRIEILPGGAPDDPGARLFFGEHADLSQIVIFPVTFRQRHGVEDLRLTRFIDDDGAVSYLGTYTAFSGEAIRQELLRTDDFRTFELQALRGGYAATKGMALFPRRLGGYYAMLGRQDHENIWFLRSNDLYDWSNGAAIIRPRWPWEFVQIGNCGPPIEIEEGWLVLTHGVGSVRNYCIGACLLDRHDPTRLLGRTPTPLITPTSRARNGYVPNVVYSCGALAHGRTLFLPYGVADTFTAFASVSLDALVGSME